MMKDSFESRVAATERLLLQSCEEQGHTLTGDMRVSEAAAAELLGITASYLKQKRGEGAAPPAYARGVGDRTRVSYRLSDLAAWIESARENFYGC